MGRPPKIMRRPVVPRGAILYTNSIARSRLRSPSSWLTVLVVSRSLSLGTPLFATSHKFCPANIFSQNEPSVPDRLAENASPVLSTSNRWRLPRRVAKPFPRWRLGSEGDLSRGRRIFPCETRLIRSLMKQAVLLAFSMIGDRVLTRTCNVWCGKKQ